MAKVISAENTVQYGYTFVAGKAVEVPEGEALKKFRGNRFFTVKDEPKSGAMPVSATTQNA